MDALPNVWSKDARSNNYEPDYISSPTSEYSCDRRFAGWHPFNSCKLLAVRSAGLGYNQERIFYTDPMMDLFPTGDDSSNAVLLRGGTHEENMP
jgi:hypothetical protein